MQKLLAVITAVITIITAVLGLAAYVGVVNAERYHLASGIITLVMVLLITHQVYHGTRGR
jgi:uncharacterized membrane protein